MQKSIPQLDWSKSFMYSIHQTEFLVKKHLEHRLNLKHGITFSQFLVLLSLRCNEKASQVDVAEFLHVTQATVSRHIVILSKQGLLSRNTKKGNRRTNTLQLTKKGERALSQAQTIIEHELEIVFGKIPSRDRKTILHAFELVLHQLTH